MKALALILVTTLYCSFSNVQQIKNSSEKPLSKNAGRTVELKEIHKITDKVGEYFFRNPYNIQISPKGDVFVQDSKQLLHFGPDGNFRRNLFNVGEGPGEMTNMSNYQLTSNHIIIHATPPKIMRFDYEGKLVDEVKIRSREWLPNFLFFYNGYYYFLKPDWTKLVGHEKIVDVPQQLFSLSADGMTATQIMEFPCKYFIAQTGGEKAVIQVNSLITTCLKGRFLLISHTPEYSVKLFNAESNELACIFQRKYLRVKATNQALENQPVITMGGKSYTKPEKEFQDDIIAIVTNQEMVWVLTSTDNPKMGVLIDVFDVNGTFLDSFFLKFPSGIPEKIRERPQLAVRGRVIYAVRRAENHTVSLVKYMME